MKVFNNEVSSRVVIITLSILGVCLLAPLAGFCFEVGLDNVGKGLAVSISALFCAGFMAYMNT